jgi:multiple sugar transport system substrate-binding protein
LDKLGLIANIQPYFTQKELERYIPAYLEEGLIGANKELLSFPVAKSTELLYIENVAYQTFKNAVNASDQYDDVDDSMFATFEGILEIANIYYDWTDDKTPDVSNDGKAFFGLDSTANYISVCARQLAGTPPVTVTGGTAALTFERETARTLWEYYTTGIATGRFAEIGWYRADDMKTGDLISYLGSSGGASYFPLSLETGGQSYETELLVLPQPVFSGKSTVTLQQGAGMSIIKTEEKRQRAAAEFLKWFTSPEQNVGYSIVSGYSPVMKLEYTQKFLDPALKKMSDSGDVLNQNIAGVLSQAAGQMDTYTLSFDVEYPGSYDIRNMLGDSLTEFAASGDTFEHWYIYIQDEFNRMISQ